jgi:PAS domain S-box-containing protein
MLSATIAEHDSQIVSAWLQQAQDLAVVSTDPHGRIVAWLGGAQLIFGYTPQEAIGQHIAFLFTKEDQDRGYPAYDLKVAACDRYADESRWHVRKDHTRIWASGSVTAVRSDSGEIIGFVKVMRDTTDQRTKSERFEHEIAELREAREQTRRFLRTLGHEIRNPLGVLTNVASVLARVVQEERAERPMQLLRNQLAVLKRLADDLMDVARLEVGKVPLDRTRVDLRALLEEATTSMQQAAAGKHITLQALLPPSPLMVDVDVARIQQVICNLLQNALKYTHIGGSIWVKAIREGHEVVCRIQDTGIGIFPPVLPNLFDLFSQAQGSEDMRAGGIGVGLAVVRQIVELHSGTVQAKSPGIGKGSEFTFRLPAAND